MNATNWHPQDAEDRACKGQGRLMWPHDDDNRGGWWDPTPGLNLCARCPILDRCRAWALAPDSTAHDDTISIIGGLTARQRHGLPTKRALNRRGPAIQCICMRCASCKRRASRLKDRAA